MSVKVQQIYSDNPGALSEAVYVLPPGLDLDLQSVRARVSGAGASAPFIMVCELLTSDNRILAQSPIDQELAIGDTGALTWAPFLRPGGRGAVVPGGGEGKLIYKYTVTGSDKASIDTLVDGIYAAPFPGGFNILEVWMLIRTDDPVVQHDVNLTINGLGTNIYDDNWVEGINSVAKSANNIGAANWFIDAHGSGGSANAFSLISLTFPFYDQTNAFKVAYQSEDMYEPAAATMNTLRQSFGIRTTAAITSFKVAAQGAALLKVGSAVIVYLR